MINFLLFVYITGCIAWPIGCGIKLSYNEARDWAIWFLLWPIFLPNLIAVYVVGRLVSLGERIADRKAERVERARVYRLYGLHLPVGTYPKSGEMK
jgi:hypothetical protein